MLTLGASEGETSPREALPTKSEPGYTAHMRPLTRMALRQVLGGGLFLPSTPLRTRVTVGEASIRVGRSIEDRISPRRFELWIHVGRSTTGDQDGRHFLGGRRLH